jgi:cytochrome oxidase assembly protein ShyY1
MGDEAAMSVMLGLLVALVGIVFVVGVWQQIKRRWHRRKHERKLRCIVEARPWWGNR